MVTKADEFQDQKEKLSSKKFIFILNPTAGKQKSIEIKDKLEKKFVQAGLLDSCIFEFTTKPMHAIELAREYGNKYREDAIIYACGGDGTVNEVVNGLIGTGATLSIIPAGTGNDFIKSVYSTNNIDHIIEGLFDYKERDVDVPTISDRLFINVASLGFDTIVGDKAKQLVSKMRFLGGAAYFVAVFVCLFGKTYTSFNYDLNCIDENGGEYELKGTKDFVLTALANGGYYGGMFNPCPDALVDDGLLDVCMVNRLSVMKMLALLPKYIKGSHTNHKAVTMHKVKSGRISGNNEQLLINCDGESFVRDDIEITVSHQSVKLAYY